MVAVGESSTLIRIRNASAHLAYRVVGASGASFFNAPDTWRVTAQLRPMQSVVLAGLAPMAAAEDCVVTTITLTRSPPGGEGGVGVHALFAADSEGVCVECAGPGPRAPFPRLVWEAEEAIHVGPWRRLLSYLLVEQNASAAAPADPRGAQLARWVEGGGAWDGGKADTGSGDGGSDASDTSDGSDDSDCSEEGAPVCEAS